MARIRELSRLTALITTLLLLVGCSTSSLNVNLPSKATNCTLSSEDISRANLAVSDDRDTNKKSAYPTIYLFSTNQVLKMILTNPHCFSSDVVLFVEQGSGRTRNYDYTATSPLDPESTLDESFIAQGLPLTNDLQTLQSALNSLFINEDAYIAEEDKGGFELQSAQYGYLWSLISDDTVKKNSKKFTYFKASGYVRVSGSNKTNPEVNILFGFDNASGKEVFCNSIRIESAGESFLIPGKGDCGWATLINKETVFELLFQDNFVKSEADYENWIRFLSVMASNEFTVRAIDEDGEVHIFRSRNAVIDGELKTDKGLASKRILSLLEAIKALELGLTYEGYTN